MTTFARVRLALCLILAGSSFFSSAEPEVSEDVLRAGGGYSSDTKQVTQAKCFKVKLEVSGREESFQLSQAISSSDLEYKLGLHLSVGGLCALFSGDSKADYLKEVQEQEHTLSLNYFVSYSSRVTVDFSGWGIEALNDFGQRAYENGTNPKFGLTCGDYYIASYKQGAFLTMGLKVAFENYEEKVKFTAEADISANDIVDIFGNIEKTYNKTKISATISVHAHQIGGEPNRLSFIMDENVICEVSKLDNCRNVAVILLGYAKTFGNQIPNDTRLEPLGEAAYTPIDRVGLVRPGRLVTPEVFKNRRELVHKLKENQYYVEKFESLLRTYPVKLHHSFRRTANSILQRAKSNVYALKDPQSGAVGCFTEPENCRQISDDLNTSIQNITADGLKFLEDIKYVLSLHGGIQFYNSGRRSSEKSWVPATSVYYDASVTLTNETFVFDVKVRDFYSRISFNGDWNADRTVCKGTIEYTRNGTVYPYEETVEKRISEFYFDDYDTRVGK